MTGLSVRDLLNNVCLCGLFAGLWFLELVKDGSWIFLLISETTSRYRVCIYRYVAGSRVVLDALGNHCAVNRYLND